MTLNAVLGDWDQNSYVTLAEADAYFTDHVEATRWSAIADASASSALIQASKILDTSRYFVAGDPFFPDLPYAQALKRPLEDHDYYSGIAASGSSTTLVCAALADVVNYRDDFFNYGSVRITAGTGIYQHVGITDFAVTTGTLTGTFSPAPDSTSQFVLLYPLKQYLKDAVCEMALEIGKTGGQWDAALNAFALEPGGKIPRNVIPGRVLAILKAQQRANVKVVRV